MELNPKDKHLHRKRGDVENGERGEGGGGERGKICKPQPNLLESRFPPPHTHSTHTEVLHLRHSADVKDGRPQRQRGGPQGTSKDQLGGGSQGGWVGGSSRKAGPAEKVDPEGMRGEQPGVNWEMS